MNERLISMIRPLSDPRIGPAMLFAACVSWPFYILQSGRPQIFVIFLLFFCLAVLLGKTGVVAVIKETRIVSIAFGILLAYSFIVNGYYAIKYDSFRPILYSMYFMLSFGIAIFLSASLTANAKILEALYYGIVISLLVQGALLLLNIGDSCARQVMYFNNPNQLAFYALLSLSFLVFLYPVVGRNIWLFIAASTVSLILILVTHSRAAFLCAVLLIVIQLVAASKPVKLAISASVLIILTLGVILDAADIEQSMCTTRKNLLTSLHDVSSVSKIFRPIGEMSLGELLASGQGASRLASGGYSLEDRLRIRGYDRIWNYPEYLLFGSGEGLMREYSFNGKKLIEFHSSVGTLVFSYGAVGSLFAIYLISLLIAKGGVRGVLLLLPLVAYSLSHNTLRQPFLWMFLVLIIHMAYVRDSAKDDDSSETPDAGSQG